MEGSVSGLKDELLTYYTVMPFFGTQFDVSVSSLSSCPVVVINVHDSAVYEIAKLHHKHIIL